MPKQLLALGTSSLRRLNGFLAGLLESLLLPLELPDLDFLEPFRFDDFEFFEEDLDLDLELFLELDLDLERDDIIIVFL